MAVSSDHSFILELLHDLGLLITNVGVIKDLVDALETSFI